LNFEGKVLNGSYGAKLLADAFDLNHELISVVITKEQEL